MERSRWWLCAAASLVGSLSVTIPAAAQGLSAHLSTGAAVADRAPMSLDGRSRFVPVAPCRLLDTRTTSDANANHAAVDGFTWQLKVTEGACGVPADASAVALSVTVTDTSSAGFVSLSPAGTRVMTSSLNWSAGETRASSTVVAVPRITGMVYASLPGGVDSVSLIVDVTGAWVPTADAVAAGRLVAVPGRRVLDTRADRGRVGAGSVVTVGRERLDVPSDAIAVVGTLTATNPTGYGFLTAFPAGSVVPVASNVNVDAAGQSRAGGVIVELGAGGLSVFAGAMAADVLFDVTGYITGPSSEVSTLGLLVPVVPTRLADSRDAGGVVDVFAVSVGVAPYADAISGVIVTVTAVAAVGPGYLTITDREASAQTGGPQTSALNWSGTAGAVATMTVQPVFESRGLGLSASSKTHLVVDVNAYLLAAGVAPVLPVSPPPTELSSGAIRDVYDLLHPEDGPLALLHTTYTDNELRAAGGVSIVAHEIDGGYPALVPYNSASFSWCGPEPRCIIVAPSYWENAGRDPVNSHRVMISHEFGHVLSMRYQRYIEGTFDEAAWRERLGRVNEECLADMVASTVLARGGFQPNETPDYAVHYMCDEYWTGRFGADQVAAMKADAQAMANTELAWAEQWGAAHTG